MDLKFNTDQTMVRRVLIVFVSSRNFTTYSQKALVTLYMLWNSNLIFTLHKCYSSISNYIQVLVRQCVFKQHDSVKSLENT